MGTLRSVNLNLMPILRELLRKKNVTHAAEALSMSQPAVSEALGRLRQIFSDEILVPEGRKLRPTALALRIEPLLERSLGELESLVQSQEFNPTNVEGTIKIATADYVILMIGPRLVQLLAQTAPKLSVHFLDLTRHSFDELAKGGIDYVLSPNMVDTGDLKSELLFEDRVVCLVGQKSPIGDTVSESEFWSMRHAAFSPGDALSLSLQTIVFQGMGKAEPNSVLLNSFLLLPFIVESSDTIAVVPGRLAERAQSFAKVRMVGLPFDFPPLRVHAIWNNAKSRDPLHRWFRAALVEAAMGESGEKDTIRARAPSRPITSVIQ